MARQEGPKAKSYQQLKNDIEAASTDTNAADATSGFLQTDPRRTLMQEITARAATK
jgi:hypothetical protein